MRTFSKYDRAKLAFALPLLFILLFGITFSASASLFTSSELDEIVQELKLIIQQSPNVIRDPQSSEYIVSLGNRLVRSGGDDNTDNYYFFVINDSEINAFAAPGGFIGINSGLILASNTESELAAVMAHEIAHVRQKHIIRTLEHLKTQRSSLLASSLTTIALSLINPVLAGGAMAVTASAINQNQINFTREHEREADRIGIRILYDAGFDPHSMAKFFEKLQRQERLYYTENIPSILRTHPLDYERIADAENRASRYTLKTYQDSLQFQLFREQIRVLSCDDVRKLLTHYRSQRSQMEKNTAIQYGYALALLKADRFSDALNILQPLADNSPNQISYQLSLAAAQIGAGDYDSGFGTLAMLYDIYPDDKAVMVHYSKALLDDGQASEARKILQRAVRRYDQDVPLWNSLAHAQSAEGRKAEAYLSRAEALLLLGNTQQAINQLQHAEKIAESESVRSRIQARLASLTTA